jgi:hypothetical protein
MANPVSPVHGTTAVEQAPQPQKAVQTPAKAPAFPQDTVKLSNAAKPAPAQTSGDVDHDGDNH